ncbi:MAG: hypothetical protein V1495_04640 [Pseudomonadota bacterium]
MGRCLTIILAAAIAAMVSVPGYAGEKKVSDDACLQKILSQIPLQKEYKDPKNPKPDPIKRDAQGVTHKLVVTIAFYGPEIPLELWFDLLEKDSASVHKTFSCNDAVKLYSELAKRTVNTIQAKGVEEYNLASQASNAGKESNSFWTYYMTEGRLQKIVIRPCWDGAFGAWWKDDDKTQLHRCAPVVEMAEKKGNGRKLGFLSLTQKVVPKDQPKAAARLWIDWEEDWLKLKLNHYLRTLPKLPGTEKSK